MVVTVRNISRHTVVFRPPSGGQTDLSPGSAVELGSDRYIVTGAPAANTMNEHSESLRAHIDGILVISVWRLNLVFLPLFGGETIIVRPGAAGDVPAGSYALDVTPLA